MEVPSAEEKLEDRVLNGEYRLWKKNAPFLYDLAMTHSLEWPTLTVEWINSVGRKQKNQGSLPQKLVLGTHTAPGEQNYLMVAEVQLPQGGSTQVGKSSGGRGNASYGGTLNKIQIKMKICHEGEVHRARAMPQDNRLIATKSPFPTVCVFDYSKHTAVPADNVSRPQHRLHGHTTEGYGLSWNPLEHGQVLSGSDDCAVCMWDIREAGLDVQPLFKQVYHKSGVEDVAWSHHTPGRFGSVGDDSQLCLWDLRSKNGDKPVAAHENAHDGDINCLSFNPNHEFMLATGGSDGTVALWDVRQLKTKLHTLTGHRSGVFQVSWAPFDRNILASSGADRRLFVWDTSRVRGGSNAPSAGPQSARKGAAVEVEAPPELLFIHGGHTAKISDFSWSSSKEWLVASVAEDNILQVWQMAGGIYTRQQQACDENMEVDQAEEAPAEAEPRRRVSAARR